jgi:hypothetical protein
LQARDNFQHAAIHPDAKQVVSELGDPRHRRRTGADSKLLTQALFKLLLQYLREVLCLSATALSLLMKEEEGRVLERRGKFES